MILEPLVVYVGLVLLLGGLGLLWALRTLKSSRLARLKHLRSKQTFDPIETDAPVDDADSVARTRGIESIESHFTVTRRLLVPLVLAGMLALAGLPFLGRVPASVVSVLVAAVTVVIGLAARPIVENAMAGLVISSSKLINLGDTVRIDEYYGTVEDITPTHTTIKVWDWRRFVVPNSRMLQTNFLNYSLFDSYQWSYAEFWVSHDADLNTVEKLALASPLKSAHFAGHEPPRFWIMELAKEGVRCWVAAWANNPSDAWMLGHDMRTELVRSFRARGIKTHDFRLKTEGLPAVTSHTK